MIKNFQTVTREHQAQPGVTSEWALYDCTGCSPLKPVLLLDQVTSASFAHGAYCTILFSDSVASYTFYCLFSPLDRGSADQVQPAARFCDLGFLQDQGTHLLPGCLWLHQA